jgi:hypothetical protein
VDNLNLGTWTVDELQKCEDGELEPDGAYVRIAGAIFGPGLLVNPDDRCPCVRAGRVFRWAKTQTFVCFPV